jgi:NAD+ kinase
VMPESAVFVVTPICPHVLTNRSVIVPHQSLIRLQLSRPAQRLSVCIDGHEPVHIQSGDVVRVQAAREKLPLLLPKNLTFADILGTKLRWSGSAI